MKINALGRTGISVRRICLGTMTFGRQNTESKGFAQMDPAFDHGVNFFDTAEMYPFPSTLETYGQSEVVLGAWIKARSNRDKVVSATTHASRQKPWEAVSISHY